MEAKTKETKHRRRYDFTDEEITTELLRLADKPPFRYYDDCVSELVDRYKSISDRVRELEELLKAKDEKIENVNAEHETAVNRDRELTEENKMHRNHIDKTATTTAKKFRELESINKELVAALDSIVKANVKMAQWIVSNDQTNKAFTGMAEHAEALSVLSKAHKQETK